MSDRKPSVTAAIVASTLLLLRDDPDLRCLAVPELDDSIEDAVRQAIPVLGHAIDFLPWPMLGTIARLAERLLSPGFVAHYALRKHAVRRELRRALADGFEQVVLVGAGFDMLSYVVPPAASVFEVDHPATQRTRREAARGSSRRDVTFVSADLAIDGLRERLIALPSFDVDAKTVFVADGLLMYLERDRVEALLADMCGDRAARRLILTIVTPDVSGHVRLHSQRKLVDWCMSWLDEPFVWGESREQLRRTLERHGLYIDSVSSTMELRDEVLAPAARKRMPRSTGEVVVVARSSDPRVETRTAGREKTTSTSAPRDADG